jgi:demethylmenaquinone methyltransferase/2-methoxy-6-polyprenyl-1,4-benzoquinol methylase
MTARLPDPRPTAEKDAALVQAMFDRVAPRYDVANTVLSLGQDRHWRRVAARAVAPRPGELLLDVAAGTGALAQELRATGARVVALDLSHAMLATGQARAASLHDLYWVTGDATRLPFPDGTFSAVTIAFGLRNLADTAAGLREFARVTRPGGRLVVLEFSTPTWPPFRALYGGYLPRVIPAVARAVSSDPTAYTYLAESIAAWPDQRTLAGLLSANGWTDVRWKNLTGGIVAAHRARLS